MIKQEPVIEQMGVLGEPIKRPVIIKYKPKCPWCDGDIEIYEKWNNKWIAKCKNKECGFSDTIRKEEAIKLLNEERYGKED